MELTHASAFPQWALAARIVFAISPNSASCERVFSLLKLMFGEQQISTLADAIRAAERELTDHAEKPIPLFI